MVKFVHKTEATGSISFEYLHAEITVGSAPDNELFLPHSSVRPYHCKIVLQEESLVVFPLGELRDTVRGEGTVYGLGEPFVIGDLLFEVEHSVNTTVAIPLAAIAPVMPSEPDPTGKVFTCDNCGDFFLPTEVHTIGIVGGRKYLLCPKCSKPVSSILPPPPRSVSAHLREWSAKFGRRVWRWIWRKHRRSRPVRRR